MNDLEKRAHDIAVSILPHILNEEQEFIYYTYHRSGSYTFYSSDVFEEYITIYDEILKYLQKHYEKI